VRSPWWYGSVIGIGKVPSPTKSKATVSKTHTEHYKGLWGFKTYHSLTKQSPTDPSHSGWESWSRVDLLMWEETRQKGQTHSKEQKYEEDTHRLVKEEYPGPPWDRMKATVEYMYQKRSGKSRRE
jgi:hypothetical protein